MAAMYRVVLLLTLAHKKAVKGVRKAKLLQCSSTSKMTF